MATSQGLVLAAHGSHHDRRSAEAVYDHVDRIRGRSDFDVVRAAFWKEQPSLAEVGGTVEADAVFVVPFLMSDGYFADRVFRRELGLGRSRGRNLTWCDPVGTHQRIADVIAERVETVVDRAVEPEFVGVAVVGHGTRRHAESADSTRAHADRLGDTDRFAAVEAVFLDQDPNVADVTGRFGLQDIVVVPLFSGNGHHVRRDLPEAIGLETAGRPFGGPTRVDGHRLWYTEAIGTDPRLTDVVIDRAVSAGAKLGASRGQPPNSLPSAGAAFREWLETAPSRSQGWGELLLMVTLEAEREYRYSIRHVDDRDADRTDLEALDSPASVRARTRLDERGQYRPLRTARTLPSGWRYHTDDAAELIRGVRAVYPASVDHWYRARTGRLECTDLEAVIDRQVGRYRDLDELEPETRSAAIDACCGDCARSPAWTAERDGPDDDTLVCPEPCSFLLEAARSLDRNAGCEAVAIDPSVPPAAFDQPGNRYRARFQRAIGGHAGATVEVPDP